MAANTKGFADWKKDMTAVASLHARFGSSQT